MPGHDHAEPDHDLEALLRSIDLRTINLSTHLPRTGIERTTSEALGLSQRRERCRRRLRPANREITTLAT